MRTLLLALLAVWAGVLTAAGAADDLLSQADRAADILMQHAPRETLRGAVPGPGMGAMASRLVAAMELPPGTEAHVLGPDGRIWASTVVDRSEGPASRALLWTAVLSAPVGVTSDIALNDAWTELVRRDIGWKAVAVGGLNLWVVLERQWEVERDADHPWSGKWTGAYSRQDRIFSSAGVADAREASSLSAILLQSGPSCWIRLAASDWEFEGVGFLHEGSLRAGAGSPIRILDLRYSPDEDKLRGGIESAAPNRTSSISVFLQRLRRE